jgi:hypothetical protein
MRVNDYRSEPKNPPNFHSAQEDEDKKTKHSYCLANL